MSQIEDLIAKHCPNGVDEKLISDVATLERGKYISKKTAIPGDIPVIAGGRGPPYWHNESNRTGELLTVAGSGAYAGFVQYWDSPIFVSDAFSITTDPQLNTRFLFHWMKNKQEFLHSLKKGSGVPHVYPKDIARLKIPVPPLEVQKEIVRILDSYTQLETDLKSELEAELEARRKQYEHYRDSLLSLDSLTSRCGRDNVSLMPLGDIFVMKAGKNKAATFISATKTLDQNVPCYGGNGIRGFVQDYNQDSEIVLIGRQGALSGNVHYSNGRIYATEHAVVVTPKSGINMRFAYYLLTVANLDQYVTKSAQPGLSVRRLNNVTVPVPPLSEQERIVAILDKFDALVNDLSSGLPAEIAARRKQYEYYRDQLLTFTPAK